MIASAAGPILTNEAGIAQSKDPNVMAHTITELCSGCGLCAKKCPVEAIGGVPNTQHVIYAELCIDCGICGNLCPKSAVMGPDGQPVAKKKLAQRPKAIVDVELCSGCEACAAVCPEACIAMQPYSDLDDRQFFPVAVVTEKRCIGCGLCETVCIKEAVTVEMQGQPAAT